MHIRVNGLPAPQGSKTQGTNGNLYESSRAVGPWREAIRSQVQQAIEGGAAVLKPGEPRAVVIQFYLPRPRGHYSSGADPGKLKPSAPAWPAVKPDLDKLVRAVLDGLTTGGALDDDARAVTISAAKSYADSGDLPGAEIWINPARPLPSAVNRLGARMTVTDSRPPKGVQA